jgi:hypothetical protein
MVGGGSNRVLGVPWYCCSGVARFRRPVASFSYIEPVAGAFKYTCACGTGGGGLKPTSADPSHVHTKPTRKCEHTGRADTAPRVRSDGARKFPDSAQAHLCARSSPAYWSAWSCRVTAASTNSASARTGWAWQRNASRMTCCLSARKRPAACSSAKQVCVTAPHTASGGRS